METNACAQVIDLGATHQFMAPFPYSIFHIVDLVPRLGEPLCFLVVFHLPSYFTFRPSVI